MNTTEMPLTVTVIAEELRKIGVRPGMTVIAHTSLKSFNRWILGGASALVLGMEQAIGPDGTLVMPAHTPDLSEPSYWQYPPVPEAWWELIRSEMPPFDPHLTPTGGMGETAECFRKGNGVLRSGHPQVSFASKGPNAAFLTEGHSLNHGLGEQSPLARLYELGGWVLLIGVGFQRNTTLHLAENRANYPSKTLAKQGAPCLVNGERKWLEYEELDYDITDFSELGEAFRHESGLVKSGFIGDAPVQLMPVRELVDFGTKWMSLNRN